MLGGINHVSLMLDSWCMIELSQTPVNSRLTKAWQQMDKNAHATIPPSIFHFFSKMWLFSHN